MAAITVILPTYNRAHTLVRALDSVLLQKNIDFELIIVDDGSTDDTAALVEKYLGNIPVTVKENRSFAYYKQSQEGVSAARNYAVSMSNGKYVAFLDSDDEWLPGILKAQWDYLQNTTDRIVQTQDIWIRNGVRVNPPQHYIKQAGDLFALSLKACMITPSSMMMEKSLYTEMDGFSPAYPACEDYALWLKITAKYPVGLIPKNYMRRYGGHADQLSVAYPAQDKLRINAILELLTLDSLKPEQKILTLTALAEKLNIYQLGCAKREKAEEVAWCESIKVTYGLL